LTGVDFAGGMEIRIRRLDQIEISRNGKMLT